MNLKFLESCSRGDISGVEMFLDTSLSGRGGCTSFASVLICTSMVLWASASVLQLGDESGVLIFGVYGLSLFG